MRLLLILAICWPCQAVKFFKDIVPAVGGLTTIAVNSTALWHGIKRAPHVAAAIPKGPKAMRAAAKIPGKATK
jgi:hypothetical protein